LCRLYKGGRQTPKTPSQTKTKANVNASANIRRQPQTQPAFEYRAVPVQLTHTNPTENNPAEKRQTTKNIVEIVVLRLLNCGC